MTSTSNPAIKASSTATIGLGLNSCDVNQDQVDDIKDVQKISLKRWERFHRPTI